MAPLVYTSRRARSPDQNVTAESTPSSSPSFRMRSSPSVRGVGFLHADTSNDTSFASTSDKHIPRHPSPELETDLEESDSEISKPARTLVAGRMQKRAQSPTPLFFPDSDQDQDAEQADDQRTSRMDRLRDLAKTRATRLPSKRSPSPTSDPASKSDKQKPTPTTQSSPMTATEPSFQEAISGDSGSSSELELDMPSKKTLAKGLSRKEQREMHSVSARLRREQRASLHRAEPKRYQLSELLSTIQHGTARKEPQTSSDPVESSSTTAPRSTPEPTPQRFDHDGWHDPNKDRVQRKWAMLRAHESPVHNESEEEVEVIALTSDSQQNPNQKLFRPPPKDMDRAEMDHHLIKLGLGPRTPRAQRIASSDYRSPNASSPMALPVPASELSASAHAFALAARKVAGTLPVYSPSRTTQPDHLNEVANQATQLGPHPMPIVMDLAQLNETLLYKSYEQNAKLAAKRSVEQNANKTTDPQAENLDEQSKLRTYSRKRLEAEQSDVSDASWHESSDEEDRVSDDESVVSSGEDRQSFDNKAISAMDMNMPVPIQKETVLANEVTDDEPNPFDEHAAKSSSSVSVVQNKGELDVDLSRFFAPTQVASPRHIPSPSTITSPESRKFDASHRTDSNTSVLAQFFESTQDQYSRSDSLDLFANQRRDGPVGGMTQFFEPTPSNSASYPDSGVQPTRSQEAMPPPTHGTSHDQFAALRKQQQEEAHALGSPQVLPSLDASWVDRTESLNRETAKEDQLMYINQDGFFTQTKPADDVPSPMPNADNLLQSQMSSHRVSREDSPSPTETSTSSTFPANADQLQNLDSGVDYVATNVDPPGDNDDQQQEFAEHLETDTEQHRDTHAHWAKILANNKTNNKHQLKSSRKSRATSAFVFGEAEESDEDQLDRDEHGGLAGVFSDHGSDSQEEENSDDDADLESLLDDDHDENQDEQDEAALERYQQHREEDDAAMQALHERATKGMLKNRRRRLDDPLADLLDEDAEEEELRRKLHAPSFRQAKQRKIDQDGLQALAHREDSRAFLQTYSETYTKEETERYAFLNEASSDEGERVTAHDLRAEIRNRTRHQETHQDSASSDEDQDAVFNKLKPRRIETAPRIQLEEDDSQQSRLLFHTSQVNLAKLPREAQERRDRLLQEYSHEPHWRQARGGRDGIDRRRTGKAKRNSVPSLQPKPLAPTHSAPSVLVRNILCRDAQFSSSNP
ncbi:hypothetical protein MYAM1_003575 [Malassezia yamatoensis]|uniref:DNA replication checkpoint mediator MRC1 domain-containing protein n=1 Tax=Malassezia yamatoensis TaxID=253288 RepID=A0AAJ5YY82_9BASI|nr:hypothetical protein MYAM1_003575 [Malassezia yamatoensis]